MKNFAPHRTPEEPTMTKESNTQTQQPPQVWVKLTVLLVIVICTIALLGCHVFIAKLKEENRYLQQQAMELEEENKNLQSYIDNQGTDEGVKDVAKDQLGMVDPDTIIYDFD